MTKSHDLILKTLKNKAKNLNENDIEIIRKEYPFLSFEEFENIGYIEEIIEQLKIPKIENTNI